MAEKPFIGYHAVVALLAAARELPIEDLTQVRIALRQAKYLAAELGPDIDRAVALRLADEELERRLTPRM